MALSSTKYRVGMPPVRPLPLENSYDTTGVASPHILEKLYDEIADILNEYGIRRPQKEKKSFYSLWDITTHDEHPDNSIALVFRSIPNQLESARLTLLITAIWSDVSSAQTWECAAKAITPLVAHHLPWQDVDIEMIATYLTTPRNIGPVGHNPGLMDNWDRLSSEIDEILQGHPASEDAMTVITICRMGYGPVEENPITVYVAVGYDCREADWPPIITDIRKVLKPYNLELFFEHNVWKQHAFDIVPNQVPPEGLDVMFVSQPYQSCPNVGADIGAAKYIDYDLHKQSPPIGTLGCYIELRSRDGEWKTMCLTNYHVCRPCIPGYTLRTKGNGKTSCDVVQLGSPLQTCDRNGFGPSQASGFADVEHPSRIRHNLKVIELESIIPRPDGGMMDEDDELIAAKLAQAKAVFDEGHNILGKPWAGAGFDRRSPETNSILDWALIEVNTDRQGRNLLPDFDTWTDAGYRRSCSRPDGRLNLKMYRDGTTLQGMASGTNVFKYGAITGATAGTFPGLMARTRNPIIGSDALKGSRVASTKASKEFVVESFGDHHFSQPGDSGAIVFDKHGHALGLVVRSITPSVAKPLDYWTVVVAIDQIFEDIKRFTKATEVRLLQG